MKMEELQMNHVIIFLGFFLFSNVCIGATEVKTLPAWPDQPFLIYVPKWVQQHPDVNTPVVFSLHGFRSNGEEQQMASCADGQATSDSCLDRVADKKKFIVIYPNGEKIGLGCRLPNQECFPRMWRPTGGCSFPEQSSLDNNSTPSRDNEYLAAVLTEVERSFTIDPNAVFFSGISNGAAMAFDIGCQLKDKVAAVALVAGTGQLSETCSCRNGMRPNVLQFHGTTDPVWPYGAGHKFVEDIAETAECEFSEVTREIPNRDLGDRTTVVQHSFQNCHGGSLMHYEIIGGGHTWPGGFLYSDRVGRVTRDIKGSEVIWQFFDEHKK
jgi:polyhydroxybutyrate depolymerase